MSTVLEPVRRKAAEALPPLRNGDHLDQRTFHERYLAMPESFRAELIRGMVHVPSPVSTFHADYHGKLIQCLGYYETHTPGTHMLNAGSVILDEDNEPQPDGILRIRESCGGASHIDERGYLAGSPELHAEVSYSTEAIDLYEKHDEYAASGVLEYVVVLVRERAVRCFRFQNGTYVESPAGADGIWRSRVFPGLWLNVDALLRLDGPALLKTLEQGLKTPEHAAFVQKLQAAGGATATANPE